jgi:hypothetical protein
LFEEIAVVKKEAEDKWTKDPEELAIVFEFRQQAINDLCKTMR